MLAVNSLVKEEIINIRYSDLDLYKRLKPFSLLNFFQDIASDSAEALGFGYSAIYPKNLMWVLIKYRIEFSEYPTDINDLILKTEPRGRNKIFAYRNFELLNGEKTLAKASSVWSLVDINTMKPAMIEDVVDNPNLSKFEKSENDLNFNKIPAITQIDYEKEFEVRYNDIDVNMHANNGNYIVWALEPLPSDFHSKYKLKTIDMVFKKEIKYGEKMVSKVQLTDGNITLHSVQNANTNEDLCILRCEWCD